MNTITDETLVVLLDSPAPAAEPEKHAAKGTTLHPLTAPGKEWSSLLPLTTLSLLVAFLISRAGWFEAGDNIGYYLGLVGGVMMLLLLLYPLRKNMRALQNWGAVKYWFGVHMVLGIAGPVLVIAHSTFKLRSTNASVAMVCMLIVAGSGIIGRFLYTKVHRGLYGEKLNLIDIQTDSGFDRTEIQSVLHFAPAVEARLKAFEAYATPAYKNIFRDGWRFLSIDVRRAVAYRRCLMGLRTAFSSYKKAGAFAPGDARKELKACKKLIRAYLASAQRVSQFSAYDRMLQLWHVAHVPLVYLLLISGIAHVVAVHMY